MHAADCVAFKCKPFIGGYRDKRTGVEYHHAIAQTTTAWEIRDRVMDYVINMATDYVRMPRSSSIAIARQSIGATATPSALEMRRLKW